MTGGARTFDRGTVALAVIALVIAIASVWPRLRLVGRPDSEVEAVFFSRLADGGHRIGSARADVQIIEFGEYLCGHCVVLHARMKAILASYPDNVALVYQHVSSPDPQSPSFLLANGAKCAAEQGAFEPFHNAVFEVRRAIINRDEIARLATIAGVPDSLGHEACMDDQRYAGELAKGRTLAEELALPGTPALRIGDGWVVGSISESHLSGIVARALRE